MSRETQCHIAAEPIEAPEPQPKRPETAEERMKAKARRAAWDYISESQLISLGTTLGIIDAYEASLAKQRRDTR
jgi:hypothetical protein